MDDNLNLSGKELIMLRQQALYWREVFRRDCKEKRDIIMASELETLVRRIGAERVLGIIADYVTGFAIQATLKNANGTKET